MGFSDLQMWDSYTFLVSNFPAQITLRMPQIAQISTWFLKKIFGGACLRTPLVNSALRAFGKALRAVELGPPNPDHLPTLLLTDVIAIHTFLLTSWLSSMYQIRHCLSKCNFWSAWTSRTFWFGLKTFRAEASTILLDSCRREDSHCKWNALDNKRTASSLYVILRMEDALWYSHQELKVHFLCLQRNAVRKVCVVDRKFRISSLACR